MIAIGYDLVEHAPSHWNPRKDKKIVVVDSQPAEIDEFFQPEVELVGDIYHVLTRLAEECRDVPHSGGSHRLREIILGRLQAAREDDGFPMQPPRALWEIRQALGREDILISDVGLHKLWIGRMFPAHEPNTVLIANGLAGMGFALPCAIAAKLVHPERRVITVNGDGGFLMNCQELETAMRLKTPIVNVVWENHQYGSIVWKQDRKFGEHFGTDFTNPDFVRLAEAFGMPAYRCEAVDDFGRHLRHALTPRCAVADRHADRLLDRRRDQRGARHRDRRHVVLRARAAQRRPPAPARGGRRGRAVRAHRPQPRPPRAVDAVDPGDAVARRHARVHPDDPAPDRRERRPADDDRRRRRARRDGRLPPRRLGQPRDDARLLARRRPAGPRHDDRGRARAGRPRLRPLGAAPDRARRGHRQRPEPGGRRAGRVPRGGRPPRRRAPR